VLIKGSSIRGLLEAADRAFGAGARARVVAALDPQTRAQLEPMVLASNLYPIEVAAAIHAAVLGELGAGNMSANRKLGAAAAAHDFSGIYRVFIRLADYRALLTGIERAWRQYNSQGVVEWSLLDRNEAECAVRDVSGFTEPMWHSIAGRFEAMLRLCGASHASVAIADWSASHVLLRARWAG
jgi:uncharacterized protein (TIGR02265 family)